MSEVDPVRTIEKLLAEETGHLAATVLDAFEGAGYRFGQAAGSPKERILDLYKRLIEPVLHDPTGLGWRLWEKTLAATRLRHPKAAESAVMLAAAVDFVKEALHTAAAGGFQPEAINFHSLAAFCIIVGRIIATPWSGGAGKGDGSSE